MDVRKELVFNRSTRGIEEKFNESIKILGYSVMLVEFFKVKEFNNVIAGQLRLLLCDTSTRRKGRKTVIIDNSLIKKVDPFAKLYPVKELVPLPNVKAFDSQPGIFDFDQKKIELSKWRDQCIFKINIAGKLQELTIFDFIKGAANKSGGAHVDDSLPEKFFIVDVHSDRVLVDIAKGFFKSIGKDFFTDLAPKYIDNIVDTLQGTKPSK